MNKVKQGYNRYFVTTTKNTVEEVIAQQVSVELDVLKFTERLGEKLVGAYAKGHWVSFRKEDDSHSL